MKAAVDGVIKGERVSAIFQGFRDGEARFDLNRVLTPSELRVEPECPVFKDCGSCAYLHIDYKGQLRIKQDFIERELKDVPGVKIGQITGMYYPYKYRNKIHFAAGRAEGRTILGFFEEGSKEIIDIKSCILHGKWAEKLYQILIDYIERFKIKAYDIDNKDGVLRYVTARCIDNKILVTLVIYGGKLPATDSLYGELIKEFKEVSLYLNINTDSGSNVYSDNFIHLQGAKTLNVRFSGVDIELFPSSFLQINYEISAKIYNKAAELIGNGGGTVIDLFSGIGLTSMIFAKNGAKVISAELNYNAVKEAKRLIRKNRLSDRITALYGDAEAVLKDIAEDNENNESLTVFADPPRKGLGEEFCSFLNKIKVNKIVYMSCNPVTLASDLKILASAYSISSVFPYDMFPNTSHLETLVCLNKIK
jgi:23S rRNA (uracil1939-C5)-methyltransferase